MNEKEDKIITESQEKEVHNQASEIRGNARTKYLDAKLCFTVFAFVILLKIMTYYLK